MFNLKSAALAAAVSLTCASASAATSMEDFSVIMTGGVSHQPVEFDTVTETQDVTLTHHHSFGPFNFDHHMSGEVSSDRQVAQRKSYNNFQTIAVQYKFLMAGLKFDEDRTAFIGAQQDFIEFKGAKFGAQATVSNFNRKDLTKKFGDAAVGGALTLTAGIFHATWLPGKEGAIGLKVGL